MRRPISKGRLSIPPRSRGFITSSRCIHHAIFHIQTICRTEGTGMVFGCDTIYMAHFIVVRKARLSPALHLNGAHDLKPIAVVSGLAGIISNEARVA